MLSNLLLVLGCAFLVGGVKVMKQGQKQQKFNITAATTVRYSIFRSIDRSHDDAHTSHTHTHTTERCTFASCYDGYDISSSLEQHRHYYYTATDLIASRALRGGPGEKFSDGMRRNRPA